MHLVPGTLELIHLFVEVPKRPRRAKCFTCVYLLRGSGHLRLDNFFHACIHDVHELTMNISRRTVQGSLGRGPLNNKQACIYQ